MNMIGLIIYVIFMLLLLIFSWRRPGIVVGSSLCMFGLEQFAQATNVYFVKHSALTNILLGFVVLIAVARQFIKYGVKKMSYGSTGLLTLLLFMYALTSILWSPRIDLSIERWWLSGPYIFTYLVLAPLVICTKKDLDDALKTTIFMGFSIIVLLLFVTDWSGRGVVVAGVINKYGNAQFGNPLVPATIAGYAAICAALSNYWGRSKLWMLTRYIIIVLAIALAIKTGSRGQAISLVIVLIGFWSLRKNFNLKSILSLVFLSITIIVSFEFIIEIFWSKSDRWNSDLLSHDLGGRFNNAFILLEKWFDGDLFTILFGLGNSASYDPKILGIYPHIVPLEVLGEEGLIGIAIYGVILIFVLKQFLGLLKHTKFDINERCVVVSLAGLFAYLFLLSLKQGSLIESYQLFLIAIIINKYFLLIRKGIK